MIKTIYSLVLQFLLIKTLFSVQFLEFKTLTEEQRQIHSELVRNVLTEITGKENRFCVAIKINYNDGIQKILIIKDKYKETEKKQYRSRKNKQKGIVICQDSFRSSITEPTVFSSHKALCDKFNLCCCTIEHNTDNQSPFLKDNLKKCAENGLTHSEFRFIAYFLEEQEMLLQEIFSEDKEITSIELHGFTLRDMCDLCYHHFELFFQKFKDIIRNTKPECETITFFISSLFSYEHNDYNFTTTSDVIKVNAINCVLLRNRNAGSEQTDLKRIKEKLTVDFLSQKDYVDTELKKLLKSPRTEQKNNSECMILEILPLPQGEEIVIEGSQVQLRNVAADGNCGVWALLQALYPEQNFVAPTEELDRTMMRFRISVANLIKEDNVIKKRIMSQATSAGDLDHWLYTDFFRYFAQAIGRPIGIIVYGNGYRIYAPNGNEIIYDNMLTFRTYLDKHPETLTIGLIGNHYQTVTSIKDL